MAGEYLACNISAAGRERRVSSLGGRWRLLGRLAGARLAAAAARPAPYHTNKIYLMDNRPNDEIPFENFPFYDGIINVLSGIR